MRGMYVPCIISFPSRNPYCCRFSINHFPPSSYQRQNLAIAKAVICIKQVNWSTQWCMHYYVDQSQGLIRTHLESLRFPFWKLTANEDRHRQLQQCRQQQILGHSAQWRDTSISYLLCLWFREHCRRENGKVTRARIQWSLL